MMRKLLVVLIIILFVGLSINSSLGRDKSFDASSRTACSQNLYEFYSSEKLIPTENIVYAFIESGGPIGRGFYAFGPDNITRFREWEGDGWFSASAWTNDGRLFFSMYDNGNLYEVDPKTFDANAIGDGGISLNGLSYDPVTEKLYGSTTQALYEIDIWTGEQEYIGDFGGGSMYMIGMSFRGDGVLYGWDLNDYLWTIDTDTGAATQIGSLGINLNYATDGDIAIDEDVLYMAAFTLSPGYGYFLYTCNLDTGETTLSGTWVDFEITWSFSYELNMEPPVTTASFDPPYPDGCNGWYASNVTVTLNATDNTGVIDTFYKIDDGEWETYDPPFSISKEGEHTVEYYSYDYVGNIEDVKSSTLDIDKTLPELEEVKWETYREGWNWFCNFTCYAVDVTSGMARVEMYINDELHETITYPGPNYDFIIKWIKEYKNAVFKFIAFDIAGNSAYILINGSDIKSHPRSKSSIHQSVNIWLIKWFDRFPFFQRILTIRGGN